MVNPSLYYAHFKVICYKIITYNNKKNISGTLIRNAREEKGMSKVRLSQLLDTYGIYINTDELLRIEKNQLLVKDFELVAIAQILDIDLNQLKNDLED